MLAGLKVFPTQERKTTSKCLFCKGRKAMRKENKIKQTSLPPQFDIPQKMQINI